MTASEAPEVHGANTFQQQHSASWRVTGKVNANTEKNINISKNISKSNNLENMFDTDKYSFNNSSYIMGGIDYTGKIDFLYKKDYLVFGAGVGYKDGIFHHFTIGANFSHFEFGTFFGGYHQRCELEYAGYKEVNDDDYDNERISGYQNDYSTNIFAGAYAGFYFGGFFYNYSISTYRPSAEIEDKNMDVPGIASNYFTIGYRFNQMVEVSFGGIATYIDSPAWNFGVTSGITFYFK